ncbi:MAG TPA: TIGR02444 family protein [Castellaniella sp.]|uniref:TIGR02444 family protein n=1 Tax=Castellaniella sp. TaxID=1955812 RepID=UPI002EE26D99
MTSVLDDDLYWRFSLAVYQRQGVAQSCLALQADIALDVNVLLMALLAARWHRRPIDRAEVALADARVRSWREEIVVPLRAIRSRLKAGPPPAPDPRTDALRNDVKTTELKAEQIEQWVLGAWVDTLAPAAVSSTSAPLDNCLGTVRNVMDFYRAHVPAHGLPAELQNQARMIASASADVSMPVSAMKRV